MENRSSVRTDSDDHVTENVEESQEVEIKEGEINDNDVLCGRGNAINLRSGNRRFRALIRHFQTAYKSTDKKESKTKTSRAIVEAVRNANPPGRFLKKHPTKDDVWYEIGDRKAWDKTSQSLRDLSDGVDQNYSLRHQQKQGIQKLKRNCKTAMFITGLHEHHQTMHWLQERDRQFQMMRRKMQQQQQQQQRLCSSDGQSAPPPDQGNGLAPLLSGPVQNPHVNRMVMPTPRIPPQNMTATHNEKAPSKSQTGAIQSADTPHPAAPTPVNTATPIKADLTALGNVHTSKYDKYTKLLSNPDFLHDEAFNEKASDRQEAINPSDKESGRLSRVQMMPSILQHTLGPLQYHSTKKQEGQKICCISSHSTAKQPTNRQKINGSEKSSVEDTKPVKRKHADNACSSEGKSLKRHKMNEDDKSQLASIKMDNLKKESHKDVVESIETEKIAEPEKAQKTSPQHSLKTAETQTCGFTNAFARSGGTQTQSSDKSFDNEEELQHFSRLLANRSAEDLTNQRQFNELQAVLMKAQKDSEAYDGEFLLDHMSLIQELQKWTCVPKRKTVETLQAHLFGHLFYSCEQRPSGMSSLLDQISDENKISHLKVIHLASSKILSQSQFLEKHSVHDFKGGKRDYDSF